MKIWLEGPTGTTVLREVHLDKPGKEDCLDGDCYGDKHYQDKYNRFEDGECTYFMYDRPGQERELKYFSRIPKVGSKIRIKARIWGKFTQVLLDTCCFPQDSWYRHIPFDFKWDNNLGDLLREAIRRGWSGPLE